MKRRRLGMWWRLGIILTLFWLVGYTTYYAASAVNRSTEAALAWNRYCTESRPNELPRCSRDLQADLERVDRGTIWLAGLTISSILAALVWMAYGIIYGTARWVLAGRRPLDEEEGL